VLYQAELHSADRARYIGKMPRPRNRIAPPPARLRQAPENSSFR